MHPPQADPPRRPRAQRATAVALALALLSGACSDDGGSDQPDDPSTTSTTLAADQLRDIVEVPVRGTLAAAGFSVKVTGARAGSDRRGTRFVEVDLEITNVGPDAAAFAPKVRLDGDGLPPVAPRSLPEEVLAPVEPFETSLRFPVPADLDPTTTRLVLGAPGENQAAIELDGDGGIDRVPRSLPGGIEAQIGHLAVIVQGGTVRWDDPITHEMLTDRRALVVIRFDALRGIGGSPNLTSSNVRLLLADGTQVATRADGNSSPNAVIERNGVVTGLVARFEVPDPVTSPMTLVVVGPFGDGSEPVRGEIVIDF